MIQTPAELIISYKLSIVSFITCWGIYFASDVLFSRLFDFYRKLSRADRIEWGSRVVSTLHAIFVTYGSGLVLLTEDVVHDHPFIGHSSVAEWYNKVLIGYFVYDLMLVLGEKQIRTVGTLVHHILGLIGYIASIEYQEGLLICVLFAFTEITTPFVNNRWFLAITKKTNTKIYIFNGLLMTLGFIVVRVLFAPGYSFYAIFAHWDELQALKTLRNLIFLCLFGVTILNIYWTGLMVKGLLRHVNKSKTAASQQSIKKTK